MNPDTPVTKASAAFEQVINRAAKLIQEKQLTLAMTVLRELLLEQPESPAVLHMLGMTQRMAGQLDQAIQTQQGLVKGNPDFAAGYQELGLCLRMAGRRKEALEAFRQATQVDPRLVNSWKFLGDLALQFSDEQTAIEAYGKYPASSDDDPMLARALELIEGGKLGLADIVIRHYLKRNPQDARALYHQSKIAVGVGAISEAMELLEAALAIEPERTEARYDYVALLSRRQRYTEALIECDKLLRADPQNRDYLLLKAALFERSGQFEAAVQILQAMLKQDSSQAGVWTSLAMLQRTLGQQAQAISSLHRAIDHDPGRSEAWYQLADLKTFRFTDGQLEALRRAVERAPKNSGAEIDFSFALARALEGRGEVQEAFNFYLRGNAARAKSSSFKPKAYASLITAMKDTCTSELFEELRNAGCQDPSPIFVVGLPRSGSTLVEQIVTSHSEVDGAMELAHIDTVVKELNFRQQKRLLAVYPQAMAEVDPEEWLEIGQSYIDRTRIMRGSAPFFVDRMPNNFEHIGLIHLALPKARIIDVRRDPMAVGFSAFRQLFHAGQDWSYDLAHIARYYLGYVDLMAHWDRVLPGKIHHVQYEQLVAQPEAQIRGLLEYLGLPFEQACLSPEQNPRAVRAASSEQVRQEIYVGAVEHWKLFAAQLEPLQAALSGQPQGEMR